MRRLIDTWCAITLPEESLTGDNVPAITRPIVGSENLPVKRLNGEQQLKQQHWCQHHGKYNSTVLIGEQINWILSKQIFIALIQLAGGSCGRAICTNNDSKYRSLALDKLLDQCRSFSSS